MLSKFIVATMLTFSVITFGARADDANPDVAKAIQKIAERRAAKDEAKLKQTEAWQKGEARERGAWSAGVNPAPGAQIQK